MTNTEEIDTNTVTVTVTDTDTVIIHENENINRMYHLPHCNNVTENKSNGYLPYKQYNQNKL